MPPKYEAIRDKMKKKGKSTKAAKTAAARIYIAQSGPPGSPGRSRAAKRLMADKKKK